MLHPAVKAIWTSTAVPKWSVFRGIAEEAGLQAGDVVLRMKGRIIDSADTLREVAEAAEAGDVIPVLVLRQQGNAARRTYITLRVPDED
jgi:S1-C subfamily serine protease